ncbi:MAG: 7-cyano-7-deazaguanine synthase [Acidobacteriota bacterium]
MSISLDLRRAERRDSVIVCVSGGLDSCVMLVRLTEHFDTVQPVFIRNGHPWEDAEVAALRRFLAAVARAAILPLAEISLPIRGILDQHWGEQGYRPGFNDGYTANFIPGRNIVLLSAVAISAFVYNHANIALGILKGNPYPDSQPSFFQTFEAMIWSGLNYQIRIITPLIDLEKEAVIVLGRDLPLELSFSCVNPQDGRHCGAYCNKCAERQKGFALANIPDATDYATIPPIVDWHNHKWD